MNPEKHSHQKGHSPHPTQGTLSEALLFDSKISDSEMLAVIVIFAERLRTSQSQEIRNLADTYFPFFAPPAARRQQGDENRPGKRVSVETPLNAVLLFYLHQIFRFRSGFNLAARIVNRPLISVSSKLAGDIAELPPLIPGAKGNCDIWFSVIWKKILEDYQGQPCLSGQHQKLAQVHDLHMPVAAIFSLEYQERRQDLRVQKLRKNLTEEEDRKIRERTERECKNILRQNMKKAFLRLLKDWGNHSIFRLFPEQFCPSAETTN